VTGTATSEGKNLSTKIENRTPRRVLIGYDGSDGAEDAVRLAGTLCSGTHSEAPLVNILTLSGSLPVTYRLLDHDEAPGRLCPLGYGRELGLRLRRTTASDERVRQSRNFSAWPYR
jgi:hypothetical protein